MKKFNLIKIYILLSIVCFFTCCDKNNMIDEQEIDDGNNIQNIEFTPDEQKVLWQMRNQDNKISREEAFLLANEVIGFLDGESLTKSGTSRRIASVAALHNEKGKKISIKSTEDATHVEMPDTIAYLFNFNDSLGFTIIAADTRLDSPILCYTGSGTLGDSIDNPGMALFLEGAEYYIERSIIEAQQLRDSLIASILEKIDEIGVKDTVYIDENDIATKALAPVINEYIDGTNPQTSYSYGPWSVNTRVGPLLSVEWGQGAPFNANVPKNCSNDPSGKAPVGCVVVSTSYILTYWFNKKSVLLTLDGYSFNSNLLCRYTWNPNRYDVAASNSIQTSNGTSEAIQARSQLARLFERVGSRIGIEYDCDGSSAKTTNGVEFLRSLGFTYGVSGYFDEIWERGQDYNFDVVKNSLNQGRPVIARGNSEKTTTTFLGINLWSTYNGGHSWVMDGYMRNSRQVTVTVSTSSSGYAAPLLKSNLNNPVMLITTTTTSTYTEYSPYYIHHNWGWRGTDNGYYVAGSFNANDKELHSNTKSSESHNYQYNKEIFPNIYFQF